jgi:hypothetical protein
VHWYRVYGQLLASEIPFPEMRPADPGEAAWTFRPAPGGVRSPGESGLRLLGSQTLYEGCHARLYQIPGGWRIVVDDTGVYDLTDRGRTIVWHAFPESSLDFAQAHLFGRVLATAMHFSGSLVLHGSAVAYPAGAVVFLAPKHTGKSTLALALTLGGARLISDDSIAVDFEVLPMVVPGVQSLRLLGDSVERLVGDRPSQRRPDGKYVLSDLPLERLEDRPVPLAAVYLLAAAESIAAGDPVIRLPLTQPVAAASMVGQGKVSEMLGAGEAPELLRRAARLSSLVPVYRLPVLRDLSRLHEVVERVAAWHGGPAETQPA